MVVQSTSAIVHHVTAFANTMNPAKQKKTEEVPTENQSQDVYRRVHVKYYILLQGLLLLFFFLAKLPN